MFEHIERFLHRDLWTIDTASLPVPQRLGVQALRLVIAVGSEFRHRLLDARAAGLVYSTLLSLVPLLAVMFSVLKAFGVHEQIEPVLAQALQPLGEKGKEITNKIIEFVSNLKVGVLGAVGVAALFFTTYSIIDKVEESFNAIWRVRQGRPWTRKFTDYLSVVMEGPVLVFTAFAFIAAAQSSWVVQRVLEIQALGYVVVLATQFTPFLILCGVFTFLHKFVPYTNIQLSSAVVGGVTTAILWDMAGAAFATFVASSARYSAIYSSFAILILFLIWLYVSWLVVLIGAQVAFFHQHPSAFQAHMQWRRGAHASRERLALGVLFHITRRYLKGERPYQPGHLAAEVDAPLSVIEELLDEFVEREILCRMVEPPGVVLVRSPAVITMSDIMAVIEKRDPTDNELPCKTKDPVANLLERRDRAVEAALSGMTLQSFVEQSEAAQAGAVQTARVLGEEATS